jgi:hypothetical protein
MEESKSTELNVADAVSLIEDMKADEIKAFVEGDPRKTVTQAAEARIAALERAEPKPEVQEVEDDALSNLYTIRIPEVEGQVKNVTVRAYGTNKQGRNISCEVVIPRGIDVPNVPQMAINVLNESVERRFTPRKKDGMPGNELEAREVKAYDFSIVEGPYTQPKPVKKKTV